MKEESKKRRKRFHKDLKGFDIRVNPFGELESTFDVDKINSFLNKNVDDKKLRSLEDQSSPPDEEE